MKVSLNKANKIRNQVDQLLQEQYSGYQQLTTIRLNGYEGADLIQEKIDEARGNQALRVASIIDLADVLYELRGLIQKANMALGINDVIGELAKTEELIKAFSNLDQPIYTEMVPAKAMARANEDVRIATPQTSTRSVAPFLIFSAADPLIQAEIVDKLKTLKKASQVLQEKRNELNHSKYLELPETMVEVLTEYEIV